MSWFGGGSDTSKDSGKDAGHTAAGWASTIATGIALAAGGINATVDPLSASTGAEQAGHYLSVQAERNTSAAINDATVSSNDTGTSQSK